MDPTKVVRTSIRGGPADAEAPKKAANVAPAAALLLCWPEGGAPGTTRALSDYLSAAIYRARGRKQQGGNGGEGGPSAVD